MTAEFSVAFPVDSTADFVVVRKRKLVSCGQS
jgi:hypothetical protein